MGGGVGRGEGRGLDGALWLEEEEESKAMYVGGGLFARWGGGCGRVNEAGTQAQAAPAATNSTDGAICRSAPGTDRHLPLCLSTNTQKK